jgi:TRAP-type C4-dicarboxylate transport system permease small subunit
MVIVGYSVIMRYFVNQPQTWTDEMAGYLMVGIVMFGLADTTRRGGHIGVDLVMQFLGSRGQRLIDIWGTVCMIIISGAILYSSYGMVAFSYSVDLLSEGYVEVPMWIPQSAVPLGMVLMLIASFSRLLDILLGDKPVPRGH